MKSPLSCLLLGVLGTAAAAPAQSLSTIFISNAGSTSLHPAPAVSFDLNVTNPAGLAMQSVAVNAPYSGIPGTLELYTTAVGVPYSSNIVNPAAGVWQLRATGSFMTGGSDVPVLVTLNKPVHLPFGSQGVCIVHRGCGMRWSNGTPLVYSNSDLTLSMGSAQSTAFVSTPNTPRIANLTLNYAPPIDLVDFSADVVRGAAPLTVNFTNRSALTSGAVSGYEWDFDGDSVVDSTLANPTFVYAQCGDYSPTLRVLTTAGPFQYTWSNLIAVDPLKASFTASASLVAPQTSVQFTDTTVGAVSWFWDFDNDGVTDSVAQNPAWTFGAGSYKVTLTVFNGCRTSSASQRIDAVTDSWTSGYIATNNLVAKQALAFVDLTITSPTAITLTGLDVNTIIHVGNPCPVKVWLTDGTASGKQMTAVAWREAANGTGISVGGQGPTRIALDRPILLLPGRTYGVAINYLDAQPYYASPGLPSQSQPDFTVTYWGVNTATTPFSTTPTVRMWNGGFYYTKVNAWPVGAITPFAQGCPGSLGVPTLRPVGLTRPKLGTVFDVELGGMPFGIGLLIIGVSNSFGPVGPLPLDLTFFGMPSCFLTASLDLTATVVAAGPAGTISLSFPAVPANAGFQFYMQGLTIDPALNPFGGAMSDSVALVTGLY